MSTLYIRLPSKAAADGADRWPTLPCPFALVSHGSSIERQGTAPLSELSGTVAKAQRVVLLLAANDVTVLRLQVPPLPPAKLKAALPNLVEDRLIADPSDCVVVAGGVSEGLRTIAVVQRAWLETLAKTFITFGARHISALPAQLCLPHQSAQAGQNDHSGSVAAAIDDQNSEIDITLRLSEQGGIGLAIAHEMDEPASQAAIQAICAVVPEAPITLYVPQSLVRTYQDAVNDSLARNKLAPGRRINVSADNWSRWIAGADSTKLDLMAGLGIGAGPKLDWRPWRWPMALAAAVLVINAAALNIDWWHLKDESAALRADMIHIYKSAYPKESVIIDPLAQMQQKIAIAKHNSGLPAPDDFTAIVSAFGGAWASAVAASGKNAAIDSLDYHDRSLFVRLKAGSESPIRPMQAALSKYGLALDPAPAQSGAAVWQIRSTK